MELYTLAPELPRVAQEAEFVWVWAAVLADQEAGSLHVLVVAFRRPAGWSFSGVARERRLVVAYSI